MFRSLAKIVILITGLIFLIMALPLPSVQSIFKGTIITPDQSGFVQIPGCSGTLLTNEWVLTAIHCFTENQQRNPNTITIKMGKESRTGTIFESNIAAGGVLIRVNEPFTMHGSKTGYQLDIYRGTDSSLIGKQLNCSGYGDSDFNDNRTPTGFGTLRTAILQVIPDQGRCQSDCYNLKVNDDNQIQMSGDSGGSCLYNTPDQRQTLTGILWGSDSKSSADQVSSTSFREWVLYNLNRDGFASAIVSGDFSGDGLTDFAVGFPGSDINDALRTGSVAIYTATNNGAVTQNTTLTQNGLGANETDDHFGWSLAAGDFNGDNIDDLAVGAPFEVLGQNTASGYVFIYKAAQDKTELQPWHGLSASELGSGDRFGYALTVGDFNGDGIDDLAVGVPLAQRGAGSVYVYIGSSKGLQLWQSLDQQLGTSEATDRFGFSLAAGDFNGDGKDDLAVGAPGEIIGSVDAKGDAKRDSGYVWLFKGTNSGMLPLSGLSQSKSGLDKDEPRDRFGWSLTTGDFNGDGKDDLAVGAPTELNNGMRTGTIFMFKGSSSGLSAWRTVLQSMGANELGDFFGAAITAGDLNSDGKDDLVVGVPLEQVGEIESGYVFIYKGTANGITNWIRIDQEALKSPGWSNEQDDYFGGALSILQCNRSSSSNCLLVGAPGKGKHNPQNSKSGALYEFSIAQNKLVDGTMYTFK